jgi:hypothetical protein
VRNITDDLDSQPKNVPYRHHTKERLRANDS